MRLLRAVRARHLLRASPAIHEGSQGPSLLSGRAGRHSLEAVSTIIRHGVTGSSMLDFPLLPAASVTNIATLIRSLTAPPSPPGDPVKDSAFFFGAGRCITCHAIRGQGGYPGPDLSTIAVERIVH